MSDPVASVAASEGDRPYSQSKRGHIMAGYYANVSGNIFIEPTSAVPPDVPDLPPWEHPVFELGETEPKTLYAHTPFAQTGPRVPETRLENYSGTFDNLEEGEVVERLAISGRFRPHVKNFTLRDSLVMGGEPAGEDNDPATRNAYFWLLDCTDDIIDDGLIEFVEVRPSYRSHEIGGFKGGNVKLSRTLIQGVVDGGQPHGTSTRRKSFEMHGCRLDMLMSYPDPTQSDEWTHTDGNQASGELDLYDVWGCSIHGGRTAALLVMQNVGDYGTVRIRENWLYGDTEEGSTLNTSEGNYGPIGKELFEVVGNRFNRTSRTPAWIKSATLNSPTFSWTNNVFMDDGSPVNPKEG